MVKKTGTHKIGRDARDGRFITIKKAEKDPKHTVIETIKNPPKKR